MIVVEVKIGEEIMVTTFAFVSFCFAHQNVTDAVGVAASVAAGFAIGVVAVRFDNESIRIPPKRSK